MKPKFNNELLNEMRQQQDPIADAVVQSYFPRKKQDLQEKLDTIQINADLNSIESSSPLNDLAKDIQDKSTRGTASYDQGKSFFDNNASDIMLLLGFLSLPYCYAAANGAEVLVKSKRILEKPAQRLAETAHFVFDVFHKNAFEPQGNALVSILKVRLMHAVTRWYISQSEWDIDTYGQPVNQEDMAGTNLSFSLMVVRGLRKMGRLIHAEDALAYIQYWNHIGEMLGLRLELLPQDNKEAHTLEKAIRKRQFKASEAGKKLTGSLLTYYIETAEGTPLEGKVKPMLEFLLGDSVCNLLGVNVDRAESNLFKPYTLLMKLQNQLIRKNDSYGEAWFNYKERSKEISPDSSYKLP